MKSGIYKIKNLITNEFYIGSAFNFKRRFTSHKSSLRNNRHYNYKLQNAWNEYGEENFVFEIIICCEKEDCLSIEQFHLESLKPNYNISSDATAPMANRKHSEHTLSKLKGRKTWNKGIPRTEKEKRLMSKNRKGIPCPEYMKEKLRQKTGPLSYWYGKKIPEESKKKMSLNAAKDKIECSNGKVYNSQLEASKDLKIRQGHISEHLQGKRLNVQGYKFKRI